VHADVEMLYEMIGELEIAMMTTRRPDGHLESRAMATQARADGADLWFVADEDSGKLRHIEADPHVNLSYYKDRTREWISVSGLARLSRDRAKIRELYAEDWGIWFPDEGDPSHGTPEDPRFVLIGVDVHAASFLHLDQPQALVLLEVAKSFVTGETPELGETRRIEARRGS
jgi:general stress protein 26